MFDSAIDQLRYVYAVLANRPVPPRLLARIARDLGDTVAEFGSPGEDAELLPGQRGAPDAEVSAAMASRHLRATARRAATTAYYERVFADTGLQPDDLDLAGWTQLPVTPKQALRAMPAAFVAAGSDPVVQARTTGTSGTPACVWFSHDEYETIAALGTLGATMQQGLRPRHVIAYAGCSRATMPLTLSMQAATRIGAGFVQLGTVDPAVVLDTLATPLGLPGKADQITHVTCSGSILAALVQTAQDDGWGPDDFGLEAIEVGGEVLTDALRDRALATLGAVPRSSYVLTEALPFGAGLCSQRHLHFGSDLAHVEFLDPESFEPAAPGELATIVVTPLYPHRRCTMLLRYVTGDLVRLPGEPVTCELAHQPATSDILGRYSGPSSLRVLTRPLLEVLESHPEFPLPCRYCVVGDDHPELHVLARSGDERLADTVRAELAARDVLVAAVHLHTDRAGLPADPALRADLREHSFEAAHLARQVASTTS